MSHGTRLIIEGIRKTYTDTVALDDVSLQVEPGEFFTLLGPSGCGKTTLLRSVAGFVKTDRGKVFFDEARIDNLPAQKRNIGMVFQDYAVFPHMSVSRNVGYGLKSRRVPGPEALERIAAALRLVEMAELGERMPSQLSGGQQQRVAVARAVVVRPSVLLMDEPLSNLDAKLRIQMRRDIRELQTNLKITTVYVTHDQAEALAVSDRIAVMRAGRVEQLATPNELYRHPRTEFVARFLGNENIISGTVDSVNGSTATVNHQGVIFQVPNGENTLRVGNGISFLLRSEILEFVAIGTATDTAANGDGAHCVIRGSVEHSEYGGAMLRTRVSVGGDTSFEVLSMYDQLAQEPKAGDNVALRYKTDDVIVFPVRANEESAV